MKDDLISRKNLYDQTEKWEEQAKRILSTLDPVEDEDEYARWEIILRERTAFKRDILVTQPCIQEGENVPLIDK